MSRIRAVDHAHAPAASKPLLDAVQQSLGLTPNLFKVTAHSPHTLEGLLGLNGSLSKASLVRRSTSDLALRTMCWHAPTAGI